MNNHQRVSIAVGVLTGITYFVIWYKSELLIKQLKADSERITEALK